MTPWHPRHIAERYGLFTIIVLGECVLAATVAVQSSLAESGISGSLVAAGVVNEHRGSGVVGRPPDKG